MRYIYIAIAVVSLLFGIALAIYTMYDYTETPTETTFTTEPTPPSAEADSSIVIPSPAPISYTAHRDTIVNGVELSILTPYNAIPTLETDINLNDTTAILVAQAADIRRDNGKIVGACVIRGELLSKGEAKAGYCSIINGEISLGAADATPMLEQALTSDGYFFRQYPLVVGGQLIENKPKGRAIRKALAEINGRICVIISRTRLTFHDFTQALIDAGVRNAIYLVGSNSTGYYRDADGNKYIFGPANDTASPHINYIVWRSVS